jgi:hypothetical protein
MRRIFFKVFFKYGKPEFVLFLCLLQIGFSFIMH